MDETSGVWNLEDSGEPLELYGIGDLHGDCNVLEHVLVDLTKVAKIEDQCLKWDSSRSNVWLVFCGDMVDMKRGTNLLLTEDCDVQILETLFRLQEEAQKYNSKIIILLGNHEMLNFQGNFAYVPDNIDKKKRQDLFTLGSEFAKKIAERTYLSVRINNLVFVHGGFCFGFLEELHKTGFDNLIKYTKEEIIPQLNKITKAYLSGSCDGEATKKAEEFIFGKIREDLGSSVGPMWCRDNSLHNKCENLNEICAYLNIQKYENDKIIQIIAHTPQFSQGINSSCEGRIWRIDVGMSRAFDENPEMFNDLKPSKLLGSKRAMSVLKINKNYSNKVYEFEIVTKNKLSSDFKSNQRMCLTENINIIYLYVGYFKNNRKKLKEVLPIIKKLMKKYKKLKK